MYIFVQFEVSVGQDFTTADRNAQIFDIDLVDANHGGNKQIAINRGCGPEIWRDEMQQTSLDDGVSEAST
jgi:hypothetical protein